MAKIIKNCAMCGRFFESNGLMTLCPECFERDEKDFARIREYLYEHPGAKIFEVSTELGISVSKIKRYLREGRLEIIEKNNLFLKCVSCGKPITSGYYCDECYKYANNAHDYKSYYVGTSGAKLNYSPINKKPFS